MSQDKGINVLDEWAPLISSLSEAEVQILACDSSTQGINLDRGNDRTDRRFDVR